MKYIYLMLTALIILMSAAAPCSAVIDPILLDEPNDAVFGCLNDIFIEFLTEPVLTTTFSGRRAAGNYLFFRMEMLFLANDMWEGIDKNSFSVKHTDKNGWEEEYPLDYAATTLTNLKQDLKLLSDQITLPSLFSYVLVFDVPTADKDGWTFLFRPMERGSHESYCEIEVPLIIR